MTEHVPRVSIGLAVRNGERYLEEAIDSILAQTFTDFELIISDNASTDRTGEICQRYTSQDARIRYHRNSTNIGATANENLTFTLARGEYFRWAAHDDVCEPTLLKKCVAVLDERPELVLCYTRAALIDDQSKFIPDNAIPNQEVLQAGNNVVSSHSFERFALVARSRNFCPEIYGVIRPELLRRTRLQQAYMNADRTLLAELSIYGPFYEVPEPLFRKRLHDGNVYVDWRTRMAWFNPANEGRIVFPVWEQLFDYLAVIGRLPVTAYERLRCYLFMVEWVARYGKNLTKDLLVAGYMALHSPGWRRKRYEDLRNWN